MLLSLFGDLLIVDSIHGFTDYNYHVINVTIVDSFYKSQFGAIAITSTEAKDSYVKLFEFIKKNVNFIRPPTVLIADGAEQIHNAFNQSFPGGRHIYCSFHLVPHINTWLAKSQDKETIESLTKDVFFCKKPDRLLDQL